MEKIFTDIYINNGWDPNHKSGAGAGDIQTEVIRKEIPKLVEDYKINSFLDCPCGDLNFMKQIFHLIPNYTGADIVQDMINSHKNSYSEINFIKMNICNEQVPKNDLIFCRDLLVHLNFSDIFNAVRNIKSSGSQYFLTTTFPNRQFNRNVNNFGYEWRPLNLQIAPFNFPEPLLMINEGCTEGDFMFTDKSLGLWEIKSLPNF